MSVTAATYDESKHPRHPKGRREGGRFAPKGGGPHPVPGTTVLREEYDAEVERAADLMIEMVDEVAESYRDEAAEILSLDPAGSDKEIYDKSWELAFENAAEDIEGFFDAPVEAAYDVGIDVNSWLEADDEENPFAAFEGAVYDKIGEKVPAAQVVLDRWRERANDIVTSSAGKRRRGARALTAAAAGLAPLKPPASWFENPKLDGPTPFTVTADGRVFGHAAVWGTCHTGFAGRCVQPPRSESGYRYFHLGEVETEEGKPVHVGKITIDTGHAPLTASREATARHYDHTGAVTADVVAGEDEHGIWVSGALRPDVPAEKVRALKAATLSGDWRSVDGKLELIGMLAVNVPGFPVPRAMAAAAMTETDVETKSLVAAGVYRVSEEEFDRKLRVLTARAIGGLEGLALLASGSLPGGHRMRSLTAAFDESKFKRVPKGTADKKRSDAEGGQFTTKDSGAPSGGESASPDVEEKVALLERGVAEGRLPQETADLYADVLRNKEGGGGGGTAAVPEGVDIDSLSRDVTDMVKESMDAAEPEEGEYEEYGGWLGYNLEEGVPVYVEDVLGEKYGSMSYDEQDAVVTAVREKVEAALSENDRMATAKAAPSRMESQRASREGRRDPLEEAKKGG